MDDRVQAILTTVTTPAFHRAPTSGVKMASGVDIADRRARRFGPATVGAPRPLNPDLRPPG